MIDYFSMISSSAMEKLANLFYTILIILFIVFVVIPIFYKICWWFIFKKSNENGWKSLIPIYDFITQLNVIGLPISFSIPLFIFYILTILVRIPLIGKFFEVIMIFMMNPIVIAIWLGYLIIFWFLFNFKLADMFNKKTGFALGLIFLNPIFMAILAFNNNCKNAACTYEEPIINNTELTNQNTNNSVWKAPQDNSNNTHYY